MSKSASGAKATSHLASQVTRNGGDCAQCLYRWVVMSNASLQLSKLKTHRHKKHIQKKDDDIDALSDKRVRYNLKATLLHLGFTVEEKPTLQCSYEVAYRIAKCKKPHTIAEKLIKPCRKND